MATRFLSLLRQPASVLRTVTSASSREFIQIPSRFLQRRGIQVFSRSRPVNLSNDYAVVLHPKVQRRGLSQFLQQVQSRCAPKSLLSNAKLIFTRNMNTGGKLPGGKRPISWLGMAGLVLAGTIVLFVSWEWVKFIVVGLFKVAILGAISFGALYVAYRLGTRMWRRAYGSEAPWVAPVNALSMITPSFRTVVTGAKWLSVGLRPLFRLFPFLLRSIGEAQSSLSARAKPVAEAAIMRLTADTRVHALLGPPPYETSRPRLLEVDSASTGRVEFDEVKLEFDIVGARATGNVSAVAQVHGNSPDKVEFAFLDIRVGGKTLRLGGGGRTRVIDVKEFELK